MKRILLMTFEYPLGKNYCGGVGQMVARCRQSLTNLGHEVTVLVSAEFQKKHPIQAILPDGETVLYPGFAAFRKRHPFHGFDMVIQHFVNWTGDLKRLKERRGRRPLIVYHFHSILRREKDSGFKTFNKFLLCQEKMIEIADRIVCPSQYEYDNFNRYFPYYSEKISLIENMFDIFPPDRKEIDALKNRYGINDSDVVSIYVGRLEKAKGAHVLIENLPRILRGRRDQKIFIVGKAVEKSMYRKLMNIRRRHPQKVFYIKYLEKKRLFQHYYLSDIYINSSLSESFSLSTYEGAFCKNALLLNRLPVFDRFRQGALFFSPRQANGGGFLHQYKSLINSKPLRTRLSRNAHQASRRFLAQRDLDHDFHSFIKK